MERKSKRFKVHPEVIAAVVALTFLLLVGTVAFHFLEHWSYASAFYFSVVTLSTVCYVDLTPTNDTTRLFTAIYILLGAAVALAALGAIGTRYIEKRGLKVKERRKNK